MVTVVFSFLSVSSIATQKIKIGVVAGQGITTTNKQSNNIAYSNDALIQLNVICYLII